ncbi:MAG: membrane protein insertase YidC [Pseudomonadota bacterium]
MIPTELQRLLLMVGLAATGYLLILAWTDDYGGQNAPAVAAAPQVGADAPFAVEPVAPATESLGSGDIPDASMLAETIADTESTVPVAPSVSEDRLVVVRTDVLEVWIDLVGGDLVRVRLPDYPVTLDEPDTPFVLLDRGNGRTYIGQSGLIGPDGLDRGGERPRFSSERREYDFSVDGGEVRLVTERDGAVVEKRFRFQPDDYAVGVSYRVVNNRATPFKARFFAQIKRDSLPALGEASFTLGPQPYLGAAITTAEERYEKVSFDDLDDGQLRRTVTGGWVAMLQHYFLSAWVPEADQTNQVYGQPRSDGTYIVGFSGPVREVAAGATGQWQAQFYAGPKDQERLAELADYLNLTVDYGFLWWMASPLFKLLSLLQGIVVNWGVAIIALTVVVKLILYPLSAASLRSMANMRRVTPQLKRLQDRYGDDRQKLSQEMMALYKKEKVNPLGGCLPMLLQMPVFLALYWVLFESVELRQAPFFLWIQDLAAMDKFFVLPILMGASMYFQQSLNPPIMDPTQAKVMKFMPIMFTALFLFFPAGLVLYWLTNNVLSMAQQWFVNRQVEGEAKPAT